MTTEEFNILKTNIAVDKRLPLKFYRPKLEKVVSTKVSIEMYETLEEYARVYYIKNKNGTDGLSSAQMAPSSTEKTKLKLT